jgi:rRNA small subunit aminocarboxypropyltransferase
MPSSRSTPNPCIEPAIPLYVRITGEDHPKACTGRRLVRRGLATQWKDAETRAEGPILLDPRSSDPLTPMDAPRAASSGLLVVDCSWNQLQRRGGFDRRLTALTRLRRRRLPWLLAGNPQHYGRLGELNTAEAFAGALDILGDRPQAKRVLGTFAGGPGFLTINAGPLAAYRAVRSTEELRAAEREFF